MLKLENVAKNFESLQAVDGVSLTVPRGQIIGLIGPNGSGKSTLLNLIAGSLQPTSGQIFFNERGEEVFRHVGFFDEKSIVEQLSKMGVEQPDLKQENNEDAG